MTKALVIPARSEPYADDIDTEEPGTLQKIVGGYIEAYRIPGLDARMYMNEDGVRLGLPPNTAATRMLGRRVVGNVVCLGTGAEPWDADVPQALLSKFGRLAGE